jgi:hypothetical protein
MLGFPQPEEDRHEEEAIHGRTNCPDFTGVSEQSIYRWKRQFGQMDVDDVRELRHLRQENARLKKVLAERDLEVEVMKELQAKKW